MRINYYKSFQVVSTRQPRRENQSCYSCLLSFFLAYVDVCHHLWQQEQNCKTHHKKLFQPGFWGNFPSLCFYLHFQFQVNHLILFFLDTYIGLLENRKKIIPFLTY